MLLHEIVETSRRVSGTSARLQKIELLAACLRRAGPQETPIAVAYLSGELRQRRVGVGPATLRDALTVTPAEAPALGLGDVDAAIERLTALTGRGSAARRTQALRDLLARTTAEEQSFLARLLHGELRQGALEGVMVEAIARAASLQAEDVRRAFMLSGDLGAVAAAALLEGAAGLRRFSLQLFRPIHPMLAETAQDVKDALAHIGTAALEYKLDGARVQVHRGGDDVRVFTRSLNDVTGAVPEIVEAVRTLPGREIVLDGEAIALRRDGTPEPFQVTMRRFGRKLDVSRTRVELPLACFFFDCLYLEGESWIDRPAEQRFAALVDAVPAALIIPRRVTDEVAVAEAFLQEALRKGHEGVMAKALDARYEAGARGASWLKVKPAHTLDLVVLAAEWGHGRRRGWLSNLHLGARDPAAGGFVMLGKTFKGMTDEMLEWQTQRLLEIETSRDDYTVHVRPELVVEIAFNDLQMSPHYPGGLALRFARVKGYRPDKGPYDADTIDTVRGIYEKTIRGDVSTRTSTR